MCVDTESGAVHARKRKQQNHTESWNSYGCAVYNPTIPCHVIPLSYMKSTLYINVTHLDIIHNIIHCNGVRRTHSPKNKPKSSYQPCDIYWFFLNFVLKVAFYLLWNFRERLTLVVKVLWMFLWMICEPVFCGRRKTLISTERLPAKFHWLTHQLHKILKFFVGLNSHVHYAPASKSFSFLACGGVCTTCRSRVSLSHVDCTNIWK